MLNITEPIRPARRPSEEGYILVWVIFLLAIFSLSLSIAIPRIAKEIQIDRERETMERGKQYRRAVQLYYRKFHAYPPNVDALSNSNEIRFLRKKYIDPTTGKDEWHPVRYGQNKTPTAMGFFGQPLAGSASTIAGTGPTGGSGINGSPTIGGSGSSFGTSSPIGSNNSGIGSSPSVSTPSSPTDSSGSSGTPALGGASGTSANGNSGTTTSTGLSGQTFGGAGIIGFSPSGTKESILVYKKKSHYNEWEFTYDPLTEMRAQSGNTGNIGQPASSTTTPIGTPAFSPGAPTGPGPGTNTPPTAPPAPQVQ